MTPSISEPSGLVDAWLDNEIGAPELARLENWLREDPAHLRAFVHAVSLQESLRTPRRKAATESVFITRGRRFGLITVASLAAAVALVVVLLEVYERNFDRVAVVEPEFEPEPDFNPDRDWTAHASKKPPEGVEVLNGNLDFRAWEQPGPTPEPPTSVRAEATSGTVRWKSSIDLHLDSHTQIQLNPLHPFATPPDVSCVDLTAGTLRVSRPRVNPVAYRDAVEIETPLANVTGINAEFTVTVTEDKKVIVFVTSGTVKIGRRDQEQVVKAGETVTLSK